MNLPCLFHRSPASQTRSEQEKAITSVQHHQYGNEQTEPRAGRRPTASDQLESLTPTSDGRSQSGGRLSPDGTPGNRIEQYERAASAATPGHRGEVLFEVVKSTRQPGDHSSLAVLPNGASFATLEVLSDPTQNF